MLKMLVDGVKGQTYSSHGRFPTAAELAYGKILAGQESNQKEEVNEVRFGLQAGVCVLGEGAVRAVGPSFRCGDRLIRYCLRAH